MVPTFLDGERAQPGDHAAMKQISRPARHPPTLKLSGLRDDYDSKVLERVLFRLLVANKKPYHHFLKRKEFLPCLKSVTLHPWGVSPLVESASSNSKFGRTGKAGDSILDLGLMDYSVSESVYDRSYAAHLSMDRNGETLIPVPYRYGKSQSKPWLKARERADFSFRVVAGIGILVCITWAIHLTSAAQSVARLTQGLL